MGLKCFEKSEYSLYYTDSNDDGNRILALIEDNLLEYSKTDIIALVDGQDMARSIRGIAKAKPKQYFSERVSST